MSNRKIKTAILALALLLALTATYLWQAGYRAQPKKPYSGPVEKITIGVDHTEFNALLWIATNRGFARTHGLELDLKTYQSGRDAVTDLQAGRLDLACCAEFVLVAKIFTGGVRPALSQRLELRRDQRVNRPA